VFQAKRLQPEDTRHLDEADVSGHCEARVLSAEC
jgi:hypothetical protein